MLPKEDLVIKNIIFDPNYLLLNKFSIFYICQLTQTIQYKLPQIKLKKLHYKANI